MKWVPVSFLYPSLHVQNIKMQWHSPNSYCQFLFNISLFKYNVFLSDVLSGCSLPRFVKSIIFCLEHPSSSAASVALITLCVTKFRKSAAVRGTFFHIRYNAESETLIFTSHATPYPPVCICTCSKYSGFLIKI